MTTFVCSKCGYKTEAEVHIQICPKCKGPLQIVKK